MQNANLMNPNPINQMPPKVFGPKVSVIVCCYNSRQRLEETINHLAAQDFNQRWELILVDNASTDGTADFAQFCWNSLATGTVLHVLHEPVPGLSHARLAGVRHSLGEYIVFCDDDNWLAPDFLATVVRIFELHTSVGAIGGNAIPVFGNGSCPNWFYTYGPQFAIGPQAFETGDVSEGRGYLFGAGLALRGGWLRECLKNGVKTLLEDRKGKSLSSGGDSEICSWVMLSGMRLWYAEELRLKHFIEERRLNITYLKELNKGFSESSTVLGKYRFLIERRRPRSVRRSIGEFVVAFAQFFAGSSRVCWMLQIVYPFGWPVFDQTMKDLKRNSKCIEMTSGNRR